MKYLHRFKTTEDFNQEFHGDDYKIPWVSVVSANTDTLQYNKTKEQEEEEEKQKTPLTFVIQSDGNISWKATSTTARTIEYSKDNGQTWTSIRSATGDTAPSISVVSGDTVQFRGNNASYGGSGYYNCFSGSTCSFSTKGNIMSMINSTDFSGLTSFSGSYNLANLFNSCTGLTDASELLLPATALTVSCYYSMFYGCTSLTTAPELHATTLTGNCYSYMFQRCTSLVNAPALPATTLATYCYQYMFLGCNSLTTAPELPATTLASYCYSGMFQGCTSLVNAPALPATTLASYCYASMFNNCTSLTQAPVLPATALTGNCYNSMFYSCSNLNYIKCLATDISANNCTYNWVSGVASIGTFECPVRTDWYLKGEGSHGIPSGWTRVNAS